MLFRSYKAKTSRKNKNNSKSSSSSSLSNISSLTSSSHSSRNRSLPSSSSSLEDNILDMFNTMKNITFKGKGGRRWAEDLEYRKHVKSHYKVKPAPMSGTVSRSLFGNTKVDVTVNAPSSADTTVQTSRTPGAPNTMPK